MAVNDAKVTRSYKRKAAREDIWAGYDPERVLAAFREARSLGLMKGIDKEALLRDIRAARGQGDDDTA